MANFSQFHFYDARYIHVTSNLKEFGKTNVI